MNGEIEKFEKSGALGKLQDYCIEFEFVKDGNFEYGKAMDSLLEGAPDLKGMYEQEERLKKERGEK